MHFALNGVPKIGPRRPWIKCKKTEHPGRGAGGEVALENRIVSRVPARTQSRGARMAQGRHEAGGASHESATFVSGYSPLSLWDNHGNRQFPPRDNRGYPPLFPAGQSGLSSVDPLGKLTAILHNRSFLFPPEFKISRCGRRGMLLFPALTSGAIS